MAIQAKITTIQGVELDTAYINIQNPQIIKQRTNGVNSYTFGGNANIYVSQALYAAGNIPVECFGVTCALDLTKTIMDQAYAALKTYNRITNVSDC